MKKLAIPVFLCLVLYKSTAQLTIYSNFNQESSSAICAERTIFIGSKIPNGLNNGIKSIKLNKGFMATLAENEDGTGEGFNYVAAISNLSVNLSLALQNKVSFIRVLPLTEVKKKGAGTKDNDLATNLNASWLYDWGGTDESITNREYVPMAWGSGGAADDFINKSIEKNAVSSFLAFNEPDNKDQANISFSAAIPLYKKLLRTGYRMGSPATTESQYRVWLTDFTNLANQNSLRIDFVAVHWYDWGNWLSTLNRNPDPNAVFTRFKAYITNVYNLYQKPIWITEFNANTNRDPAVHEAFLALALPWLEADPRIERYAYFFETSAPASQGGVLTKIGKIYSNHVSTNIYTENIYDKRPAFSDLVSWDTASQINGGESVSNFAPSFINPGLFASSGLIRGSGLGMVGVTSSGYWGATDWSPTTAQDGIAANKFLTFSLKSSNGKNINYSSIDQFKIRIAANGPLKYQIDYQIDKGLFSAVSTISGSSAVAANYSLGPIELSTISELQNISAAKTVTFRITPFGGSGTFYFGAGASDTDPDLSITGSFVETPVVLGLNEPKESIFNVYPTLATQNRIQAIFTSVTEGAQIMIATMNGQIKDIIYLKKGTNSQTINTEMLSPGSYLIVLKDKEKVLMKKIIK